MGGREENGNEERYCEGKIMANRSGKKKKEKREKSVNVGGGKWNRERKRETREEEKEAYIFSFFDIVRARAHRRTILHASTLPSFARFTRVPLSAAENDVEETFVWQLARRRRRRDVFRIRKPVCLYSRTTTNPLFPSHEISRNPPFPPPEKSERCGSCIPLEPLETNSIYDSTIVVWPSVQFSESTFGPRNVYR